VWCVKLDVDVDIVGFRYHVSQIDGSSPQVRWIGVAIVQGERDFGAKKGVGFSKDLLASSKKLYALARVPSLGLVAFCAASSVPASIEWSKAKPSFADLEDLVVDPQSQLWW
jgi:hypothetical protein